MKKLYTLLLLCFVASTATFAADTVAPKAAQKPAMEKMLAARKEKMAERYSKMDATQLTRRKEMLEKRLADEKNERKKEYLQIELDTINSIVK